MEPSECKKWGDLAHESKPCGLAKLKVSSNPFSNQCPETTTQMMAFYSFSSPSLLVYFVAGSKISDSGKIIGKEKLQSG